MKNALKLPITCVELCNCGKDFRDRIFFSDGVNYMAITKQDSLIYWNTFMLDTKE